MASSAGRVGSVTRLKRRVGDHRVGFNFYFDLGTFLELHFLTVRVSQSVRNPNLAIKMICTFDHDLSFFRLAGSGMRANNLFDFSWERSTCLRLFGRHE